MTAELTDWLIGVPTVAVLLVAFSVAVGSWLRYRPPADHHQRVDLGAALNVRRHPTHIDTGDTK